MTRGRAPARPTGGRGASRAPSADGGPRRAAHGTARDAAVGDASLAERLAAGLAELELALPASAQAALLRYLDLLAKWNAVYNLTAVRAPRQMLGLHLLDSLAAWPVLREALAEAGRPAAGAASWQVADVGSGAGLPGLVWAIAAAGEAREHAARAAAAPVRSTPPLHLTLIDAVEKKTAFQRQAVAELGLAEQVACVHGRVEALAAPPPGFDAIASRAFASLADFVSATRRLLAPGGRWVALKGEPPHDEIAALPAWAAVERLVALEVPQIDGAARCVVILAQRPAATASGAEGA